MSPEWIGPAVAAASVLVTGLLGWAGWGLNRRAQRATERNQSHERDDAAFAHMKSVVEVIQAERDRVDRLYEGALAKIDAVEEKRRADKFEQHETRHELETLRLDFRRLEGRLMVAIDYIRRFLAWAAEVSHPVPHPVLPDDIADLINTGGKK